MDARALATAFLPGSLGRLAALYSDGSVSIYTEDAAQAPTVVAISGRPTVSDSLGLAISPDGERIALSDSLGIRIQRLESGDALSLSVISGCSSSQLRFSAEGGELIGWGMDALCVWRVADGALLQTLTGQFASAGAAGGRLVTWEVGSSHIKSRNLGEAVTQERELVLPVGTELVLSTLRVSPRVDSFAAVARSGEHFWGNVWSAAGELQSSIPLDPELALSDVSYSPSGDWILLGGQLVNVSSGERRSTFLADTTRDEPLWKVDDTSSNDTLLATSGPELYRTSDWSRVWPQTIVPAPVAEGAASSPLFDDVRFAPDDQALLLSSCARLWEECRHELRDLNGSFIRALPELTGPRAQFSPEGHWALSADTLLHLPTNERRYLKGRVMASTFTPNGDVVGLLEDNTIVRYCRTAPKP